MIFIDRNTTNKFVLTLSESSTLLNPNYLFKFQSDWDLDGNNLIWYTTPDESNYKDRYNLFQLIESTSGSTSGGTSVPLYLKQGQYTYSVYESSASTISLSATTGVILETGRMVVGDFITDLNNDIDNNPSLGVYD